MYRSNSFKFERRAPAAADPAGPAPAAAAAPVSRATPLPPQRRHQQQQQQQVIAQQQHKLRRAGARQVNTANTTAWPLHLHRTFNSTILHEHYEQSHSLHCIAVTVLLPLVL